MRRRPTRLVPLAVVTAIAGTMFSACSGGSAGNPANNGDFVVDLISTGRGQVFPYRIRLLDGAGNPSDTIVNIESEATLRNNIVRGANGNGILPIATFPSTATLPNGEEGNQYLQISFSNELDVESILSTELGDFTTNSGLTSAISLLAVNPATEESTTLQGQGFVGGVTYFNRGGLERVEAVGLDDMGDVSILDIEASGFPLGFTGDADLLQKNTFVFVADSDNNLDTIETFDPLGEGLIIQIDVRNTVLNTDGNLLEREAGVATTVGPDRIPAQVSGFASNQPRIFPGNGEGSVDPTIPILIEFTQPVQPGDVGVFFDRTNLVPDSGGVLLNFDIAASTAPVLYYADPISFSDLTQYLITPAFVLPGRTQFTVSVVASIVGDLNDDPLGGDVSTTFTTGNGPGIVNAPVAPDVVYVGFGGANPGVSAIDLNGYGQGTNGLNPDPITGEPTRDPGSTRYADNPDLLSNPSVVPTRVQGSSTLDAGSNGLFSLVEDTSGNTNLLGSPLVGDVSDIHVGPPLDLVFNNANINPNAGGQNQINPVTMAPAVGNTIAVRPNPNPPRLRFPPPNPSRAIFGEEPSVASSMPVPMGRVGTMVPNCSTSPLSVLTQSSRLDFQVGAQDGVFVGPQQPVGIPPVVTGMCPFLSRQQIGHFLYVLDPENRQLLVVNSNRFTVLDTIRLSDPVAMTMSPSLGLIAVSNFSSSTVTFINIDPRSPFFNTVVGETNVANGPSAISWQPDGEDVLVVSGPSNALTVIDGSDFSIVTTATGSLSNPIDVAVTQRYVNTGDTSGIYYGYVLNANGSVAIYESGPDGVNGIGFEDVTGLIDVTFPRARRLRLNYLAQQGGVYIAHNDNLGVGVISSLELTSGPQGPLPVQQNAGGFILPPTFRQKIWTVAQTFGGSDPSVPNNQRLSGNSPIDITTDEILNFGANVNQTTNFNNQVGRSIIGHSSKGHSLVDMNGNNIIPYQPRFLFVALSDVGAVDIFDLDTRVRVATIDVPGVSTLSGYWKQ